jgi:hypothetical protein
MATTALAGSALVSLLGFGSDKPRYAGATSWFYGGVQFPLSTTSSRSMLRDADPALFYALDFYTFVLRQYLGPRFVAACQAARVLGSDGNVVSTIVQTAIPYDPTAHQHEAQWALPLLSVFRKTATGRYKSTMVSLEETIWNVALMLPGLDAAQAEAILPILHAAELLLENKTEQGYDPAYAAPDGALGQQAWALSGLAEIQWLGCEYGYYPQGGDIMLPLLVGRIRVAERQGPYNGFPSFQGAATQMNIFDSATSTTVPGVAVADTWVAVPKYGP